MRVLVVDDSAVFRSQIKLALEGSAGIEVAGTANNGRIALQKLAQSSVDLVTLDLEMPEMGGLETIREIRKARFPVKIIVFSSHSVRGAEATIDALEAGADDFVAKPTGEGAGFGTAAERIREELIPKVRQFMPLEASRPEAPVPRTSAPGEGAPARSAFPRRELSTFLPSVIAIGASTGGPPALEKALSGLSTPVRVPILIVQHMPPVFTEILAKRLHQITGIAASEAKNGDEIRPNHIHLAPGDFHMVVARRGTKLVLETNQDPPRNSVRPAVDPLFESVAGAYGPRAMAFVLTGMGEDGLVGARAIKSGGGGVMIQSRESCVVFGMPGAIHAAAIQDAMGDLSAINATIKRMGA